MSDIKNEVIRAYALKNAVEHEGVAKTGSVLGGLFAEGLEKSEITDYMIKINLAVNEINKMGIELQELEFEKVKDLIGQREVREGLNELEKIPKKGVVMRLAPSASGPLHIGHALTFTITPMYVKKYGGKFILRIEDTNPENVDKTAYKQLVKETEYFFGKPDEVIVQSENIETYYKYVRKLIEANKAYVCICDPEAKKDEITNKNSCICMCLEPKDQMHRWNLMLGKGKERYEAGEAVLRFKGDLKNKNPALRDFTLARINESAHPKQKKKYRVWPLMNLAVTVDDLEAGMTHVIRGKDHMINAQRQEMIYEALGKKTKFPQVYFLGMYNFPDLKLSTSEARKKIEAGEYLGWDDIRLPFLASLKRRGFLPKAFQAMTEQRGLSDVDKKISKADLFKILEDFNREILKEMKIRKVDNEKGSEFDLLMPNNQIVKINVDIAPKKNEIVYVKKIGYCNWNSDLKQFWFAHA